MNNIRRGLFPLLFFVIGMTVLATCLTVPCGASQGVALSPSKLSLSSSQPSGTTQVYNTGNTTLSYTIQFTNNTRGQLTATPSSGSLAPKQNSTITIQLAGDEHGSSLMLVNTTTQKNFGGAAQVLPAVAGTVVYSANGSAPQAQPSNGTNWELIGSVIGLVVLAAVIVVAVYMLKRW